MVNNDEIIDFGEWYVPRNWDELTLGQFQQMQEAFKDNEKFDIRKVLHIFCGKSQEEVDALPIDFAEELLGQLVWLQTDLPKMEPTNSIKIDGEEYTVNLSQQMKTGEFIQVDSILKSNHHDYSSMLAILCRKKGEVYDSRFEAEVFEDRVKMFRGAPMLDCMRVMAFFLRLWNLSELSSRLYLEVLRGLSLTRRNIQSSTELGAFRKRYLMWQVTRLWRSIMSNSPTSRTFSFISHSRFRRGKRMKRKTSSKTSSGVLKSINMFKKR